jgi:iron complex transport system substrate-binding protein
LLAISHYSHDALGSSMPLEQAHSYPITGGTVEEVLVLDPDIVVTGSFLAPATRNAFERLGMQVVTLGVAQDVESSAEQVRELAAAIGRAEEGGTLARRIQQAWEDSAYAGAPVSTLFWQADGVVAGPDSLIGRMLEHTGFSSHSAARGLGQGAYLPLEQVLADPPELVLAAADQRILNHPVLREQKDIAYATFDPSLLFCAGPSIPRALDRLVEVRADL